MSPSHCQFDDLPRRPSPLNINKNSHLIQKSSTSSLSSSTSSSLLTTAAAVTKQQQRHPVIIYTHSPKIIHTQARDFMALVQKLTGLAPSDELATPVQHRNVPKGEKSPPKCGRIGYNDGVSSSVVTDNNYISGDVQESSTSVSPIFDPSNSFSEIPLFTPNSLEFFCSTRNFYTYPDPMLSSQYGGLDLAFHP